MTDIWTFHIAAQLVFGSGAIEQLGDRARQRKVDRALLVTDRHLVAAGLVERITKPLRAAGIAIDLFDQGAAEPSLDLAEQCVAQGRAFAPNGIIGLGGGSNMDLAKISAAVLTHGGAVRDYVGENKVPGPVLPVLCLPTTSGTGSEVSAASVLTDTANQLKVGVLSNWLRPAVALVDPQLTLSCPAKVTADSGIDALTHAIEAYTAVDNARFPLPAGETSVYQGRHPLADALAEKAISLVGQHLVTAVREPATLPAREGMALAATLAGMAFSNVGVALVHAMEYPVGGATHCSHGAGNGLLLPFVMRYNMPGREAEFTRVARLLGEAIGPDVAPTAATAEQAITAVERLKSAIGIPARLRDLGVVESQLRGMAEKTFGIKRILRVNPRPVTVDSIEQIFRAAL